jgi:hypothetical protein
VFLLALKVLRKHLQVSLRLNHPKVDDLVDFVVVAFELLVSFTEKLSKVLIGQGLASLLNGMAACIDLHLDFSSEKSTDVKKPQGLRLEV